MGFLLMILEISFLSVSGGCVFEPVGVSLIGVSSLATINSAFTVGRTASFLFNHRFNFPFLRRSGSCRRHASSSGTPDAFTSEAHKSQQLRFKARSPRNTESRKKADEGILQNQEVH